MKIHKMSELDLYNKTVLIRSDLNVPMKNGMIQSPARILASIPTIELAIKKNAKIIIMSHLGRPKEGHYTKKYSLYPIFQYLQKKLKNTKMYFSKDYLNGIKLNRGEIVFLENVRFNSGEISNNDELSKKYSKLCDIFVMDAFGSAHRKESSTCDIGKFVNIACAGLLLVKEIKALKKALEKPRRPVVSVIGGSKISTKFNILKKLSEISDAVIVGGGIANTFLAIDYDIGKSLYEKTFLFQAKKLRNQYNIIIPIDSRIGKKFCEKEKDIVKYPNNIQQDEEIMDFGDESIENSIKVLKTAKTIIWNGPVGVFEFPNFRKGTESIAKTIASSNAFSLAGGGETISVIDMLNIQTNISYISTGGGAFLKFIEQEKLPAIVMLENNFKK